MYYTYGGGKLITQFKKGIVELCVLNIVSKKDMYGFEIIETLSETLDINENTIYPILRRLTVQNLFDTYTMASDIGPKRRYYKITELGKIKLEEYLEQWQEFKINVEKILGGTYE